MDLHCQLILDEYDARLAEFQRLEQIVQKTLKEALERNALMVTAVTTRIKTRDSLTNKLELKGGKYRSMNDITDILGPFAVNASDCEKPQPFRPS